MIKATLKTVGDLDCSAHSINNTATAMVLKAEIKHLIESGKVQQQSPLTDEIIEKIKDSCAHALAGGDAAVDSIEAASSLLGSLKTGVEGSPAQLLIGTIAHDKLKLIPKAIQNLNLSPNEPLSREKLGHLKKEVDKLACKHFTGVGRVYSNYSAWLYYHWKEIEERLNSQEIDSLEAELASENAPQKRAHLCKRAIALVYLEKHTFEFLIHSPSYRQDRADVDEKKIEAKFQKVQAVVEQAGLNFEEIAESAWKQGDGVHFFRHPDDIEWEKE
mgnify:CR=1 FL=1